MGKQDESAAGAFPCQLMLQRRTFLKVLIAAGIGLQGSDFAHGTAFGQADSSEENELPQDGDKLVSAFAKTPTPLRLDDLKLDGPPNMVYAMDPKTGVVKKATRFQLILLFRFKPDELSEETRSHSAGGAVAYSSVCVHMGCTASEWEAAKLILQCPCHYSEYNPRDGGKVVSGPAPRPLPALPLRLASDNKTNLVAGGYLSPLWKPTTRNATADENTLKVRLR